MHVNGNSGVSFPPAAVVLNILMVAIYILLAAVTNKYLLHRIGNMQREADDAAVQRAVRRQAMRYYSGRAGGHSTRSSQRSFVNETRVSISPPLSHSSLEDALHPHQPHPRPPPSSGSDRELRSSKNLSTRTIEEGLANHGGINGTPPIPAEAESVSKRVRRAILHDYVCWFFMLIVAFALTRGITVLATTLMLSHQVLAFGQSRKEQDTMFFPSTVLYYAVAVVLLHTFHYMSDAAAPRPMSFYRWRLGLGLGGVCFTLLICLIIEWAIPVGDHGSYAVEWCSIVIGMLLSVLYAVTFLTLPKKVLQYGSALAPLARRIRIVSSLLAVALLARSILLLPPLQQYYGEALGSYAVCVSMPFDLLPTVVSVTVLRQ